MYGTQPSLNPIARRFSELQTEQGRLVAEHGQLRFAVKEAQAGAEKAKKKARRALRETLRLTLAEEMKRWPDSATSDAALSFLASLTEPQRAAYIRMQNDAADELCQAGVLPEGGKANPNARLNALVDEHMERTGEKSRFKAAAEVQSANPRLADQARRFSEITGSAD